jgi:hypothetical protein
MSIARAVRLFLVLTIGVAAAAASVTTSYVGILASPETPVDYTVTLLTAGTVTLQTYGFGGGTNAAGTHVAAGGTDPFLAIFSGTGNGATILTDGLSNAYGTALDLSNYSSFMGCPPAGAPVIGGSAQCADIVMTLALAAGTYTVVIGDGEYIANAVFDNGTLGEGFTDLTGGNFCNAAINGVDCPNASGAYALDITTAAGPAPAPEPSTMVLVSTLLTGFYGWRVWTRLKR